MKVDEQIRKIKELKELFDLGLITEDEFESQKKKVLGITASEQTKTPQKKSILEQDNHSENIREHTTQVDSTKDKTSNDDVLSSEAIEQNNHTEKEENTSTKQDESSDTNTKSENRKSAIIGIAVIAIVAIVCIVNYCITPESKSNSVKSQSESVESNSKYIVHNNDTFHYSIEYPSMLNEVKEAEDHSSIAFFNNEGVVLNVMVTDANGLTLTQYLEAEKKESDIYEPCNDGGYVLRGVDGTNGYYTKTIIEDGKLYHLYILYPERKKEKLEPICEKVAESFKITSKSLSQLPSHSKAEDAQSAIEEISKRCKTLFKAIPDHDCVDTSAKKMMTNDLYEALLDAWNVPQPEGVIGDEEFLYYFVSGQDGIADPNTLEVVNVHMIGEDNCNVTLEYKLQFFPEGTYAQDKERIVLRLKRENGIWLLNDFSSGGMGSVKEDCKEYIKENQDNIKNARTKKNSPILSMKVTRSNCVEGKKATVMINDVEYTFFIGTNQSKGTQIMVYANGYGQNLFDNMKNEIITDEYLDEKNCLIDRSYISVIVQDLDSNGRYEIIATISDGIVPSDTYIYQLLRSPKKYEIASMIGSFLGQSRDYITDEGHIISPYGSQGLYKEYVVHNGELFQMDNELHRF